MRLGFFLFNVAKIILVNQNKDDLGAEARGPFRRGAWGGRPICHPLTPALTIDGSPAGKREWDVMMVLVVIYC